MTDRPTTEDPNDAAGASPEPAKPKVTPARATADKAAVQASTRPAKASAKAPAKTASSAPTASRGTTTVAAKAAKADIDTRLTQSDDGPPPPSPTAIPENVTI